MVTGFTAELSYYVPVSTYATTAGRMVPVLPSLYSYEKLKRGSKAVMALHSPNGGGPPPPTCTTTCSECVACSATCTTVCSNGSKRSFTKSCCGYGNWTCVAGVCTCPAPNTVCESYICSNLSSDP